MRNKGRFTNMTMPSGCLPLNAKGTQWTLPDMRFVLVRDGQREVRIASYYSSVGYFATIGYRLKDQIREQIYEGFPKASDGSEIRTGTETGDAALPHVFHERSHTR